MQNTRNLDSCTFFRYVMWMEAAQCEPPTYCNIKIIYHMMLSRGWSQWKSIWWFHQIETYSALLELCAGNSPVTVELPSQRPVTRSFDVFFDLCLNKRLSKLSWGWWFETPPRSLWRYCSEKCFCWRQLTSPQPVIRYLHDWCIIYTLPMHPDYEDAGIKLDTSIRIYMKEQIIASLSCSAIRILNCLWRPVKYNTLPFWTME